MQTRLLTLDDLDQFYGLLNRNFMNKQRKNANLDNTDGRYIALLAQSNEKSLIRVYGSFSDDGQLLSSTSITLWGQMDVYNINYYMTHPKFAGIPFYKSLKESGLDLAMNMAVEYAESKKYWQFFVISHMNNYKVKKDIFIENAAFINRYNWSIETVIPAGTMPNSKFRATFINFEPRPVNLVIKTARLKPDIIWNKLHAEGLIPFSYEEAYPNK